MNQNKQDEIKKIIEWIILRQENGNIIFDEITLYENELILKFSKKE